MVLRKELEFGIREETRGGSRANSGRKKMFNSAVKVVSFVCPIDKIQELKDYVAIKNEEWIKEGV